MMVNTQMVNDATPMARPRIANGKISAIRSQNTGPSPIAKNPTYAVILPTANYLNNDESAPKAKPTASRPSDDAIPTKPLSSKTRRPTRSMSRSETIVSTTFTTPIPVDAVPGAFCMAFWATPLPTDTVCPSMTVNDGPTVEIGSRRIGPSWTAVSFRNGGYQ
jgi:hypothetical protein